MKIKIKGLEDENFGNYKQPSMFIAFPSCTFKCCVECGKDICQNSTLAKAPDIEISVADLIDRYIGNPITKAIVCGGLEPFDSFDELRELIATLRWSYDCFDPVVIYTGYNADEIYDKLSCLMKYANIIVKFGRFVPDQKEHYDEVLGVNLASDNQYAVEL